MTTQIKITQLTAIGSANLAVNTLLPVVNMSGTPTTQKTTLGNLANVILSQAGGNYAPVGTANIAYSVSNAAQPNITSVGTLTSVSVTGNATAGNVTTAGKVGTGTLSVTGTTNLGAVGNVTITGGTSGQVLTTNGSNVLSWTTVSGGGNATPAGSNTQIQFNDAGAFAGNTGFTFNKTTGIFTSPFVAGNGNGLSNIQGANISGAVSYASTANAVAAANVSGLGNLALLSKDGNASNVLHGDGSWSADTTTYSNSNVASFLAAYGSNNITTTGNVSTGALSVTGYANLGPLSNLAISGGNSQQTIVTNGSGGLSWQSLPSLGNITFEDDIISVATNNSNIIVETANGSSVYNWTFSPNGTLFLPTTETGQPSILAVDGNSGGSYIDFVSESHPYMSMGTTGNTSVKINVDKNGANLFWEFDNSGNFNLPTDGNINFDGGGITQVINQDLEIVVQDEEDDGWSLLNTITDSLGNNLSRTTLDSGSFTITTDITGTNHSWGFEGNTLQVSNDSQIRSFGSNVVLQSMSSGSGGTASLQSVSNTNDPNIFTTFDATTTGANITVYNGGSNGGVGYTWQFSNDGRLTFPGTPRIDTDANNFEVQSAENINFEANAVVNIYTDAGNTTYQWQFGDDGNLIVPGNTAISTSNATGGNAGNSITIKAGAADQSDYYTTAGGNLNLVGGLGATDDGGGGGPGGDVNIASGLSADPAGHAGNINITAGSNDWVFDYNGTLTLPGNLAYIGASPAPSINGFDSANFVGNVTGANFIGNGNTLSNVATKTSGSWTLASGVNTVTISVPLNGTYAIWINGNIPNGIATYTATAVVTNPNVPVLGEQYAWYYATGNALVFTSIPDQFIGTQGAISNTMSYLGTTANVFTFGITNNSGSSQVVDWGYTKL